MADLNPETVQRLSVRFVEVLTEWLTPAQMAEVRARNAVQLAAGDEHGCASHDFCDANMAMDQAFRDLGIDPLPDDHMTEAACDLWNAAWDIAYKGALQPKPMTRDEVIEEALNAAVRVIQDHFGQTDGGEAGIYFSGDKGEEFVALFGPYFDMEASAAAAE